MAGTDQIRKPPYLHRNWLTAIDRLQSTGINPRQIDHEDDDARPVKRRRVIENSPDSGIGLDGLDAISFTGEGGQAEKALRIEVLKIVHRDSSRVRITTQFNGFVPPQVKDHSDTKARCRIAISYPRNGSSQTLHVDSQICTIKTYKNPTGPSRMVRIHLTQPFHVPQDKILVPREDDDSFGLADSYTAQIQLESAGDPNWPPEFLTSTENDAPLLDQALPRRQWVFQAAIENILECHRKTVSLEVGKRQVQLLPTDYVVDVDVRWTSGLSANGLRRLGPSITCFGEGDPMDLDTAPAVGGANGLNGHAYGVNGVNGINGHHANDDADLANGSVNGELPDDMDDQAEGDLTPGRRRRARPQINYNLKHLSDQAQRKERRKRQQKLKQKGDGTDIGDDQGVTYLFAEPFHLDDFECCLCGAPHHSFDQLRAHYQLAHDKFEFDVEDRSKVVSITRKHIRPITPAPKVYQLGPPVKPFDFSAFLEGDDTWITSRYGPQNGKETGPIRRVPPKPPTINPNVVPKGRPKKIIVPRTKTTLYHALSKAPLQPGTQLEPREIDESWLRQKHRDAIGDFTDLSLEEKEFIKEWDTFIQPNKISSPLYLPRAYLAFAKAKASWLVARQSRCNEFSKHSQFIYVTNVIDEATMRKGLDYLEEARRAQGPVEEPAEPPKSRASGCARCGKFVSKGPAWLACTSPGCKKPVYHDYCVTDPIWETDDREHWKCNDCCL